MPGKTTANSNSPSALAWFTRTASRGFAEDALDQSQAIKAAPKTAKSTIQGDRGAARASAPTGDPPATSTSATSPPLTETVIHGTGAGVRFARTATGTTQV